MSLIRRLPLVKKAVRRTVAIEEKLATLEGRTAELGPGVVNTLVYDSASSLEALEHVVATLRRQDESSLTLQAALDDLHRALTSSQSALLQQVTETARLVHAPAEIVSKTEFRDAAAATRDQLATVLERLTVTHAPSDRSTTDSRVETLVLQVASRVDRLAVETRTSHDQSFERMKSQIDELVLAQADEATARMQLQEHVTKVGESVRRALRHDMSEDVSAGVELLAKEIGRLEDELSEAVKSRSDGSKSEWMRLELAIRQELSGEIQRSESRIVSDISRSREVLASDIAARTTQVGTDLARSELSIRDEFGRRFSELHVRSDRALADRGPVVPTPQGFVSEKDKATTPAAPPAIDRESQFSEQPVSEQPDDALVASKPGELHGARLASRTGAVRANPIDPEVHLAAAIAPYLKANLVIDVGAHRGRWTAALVKHGLRVLAVEPNPVVAAELRKRFEQSSRVEVVESAVSATVGAAKLLLATDSSLGAVHGDTSRFSTIASGPVGPGLSFTEGPMVRTTTVAELASTSKGGVAFLKVSAAGVEFEAFRGLGNVRPEVIVAKFRGRRSLLGWPEGFDTDALIEQMIASGYRRWIGFVPSRNSLQVRVNPRTFPDDSEGHLFFIAEREVFSAATRWCDQNLMGGCL